jgi:DNA (cytosine-5)-methyltransferase 1
MAVESFFNAETVWTCEFDKYASQVIEKRINKPNHGDLKKTDWTKVEPIDILTAGYPCQPFSTAGLRKGADDERHLWPHIKDIIGILRPRFIVLENVRGHFGLGFREVLGDLAALRYDATWRLVRASDVGAPHRRERLFILAYANTISRNNAQRTDRSISSSRSPQFNGSNRQEYKNSVANALNSSGKCITHNGRVQKLGQRFTTRSEMHLQAVPSPLVEGKVNAKFIEYMMGLPDGWVTDIDISYAQQLKILGNGVVPQQAEYALELLWETYVNHQ